MFCTQCGKELREGLKFCPGCGTAVKMKAKPGEVPVKTIQETPAAQTVIPQQTQAVASETSIPQQTQTAASENFIPTNQGTEAKKSHTGIIVVCILLVLLILAVSGMAFWFLGGQDIVYDFMGISTEEPDSRDVKKEEESTSEETAEETETTAVETSEEAVAVEEATEVATVEEESESETETTEEESEYILEDSDSRYLTEDDLEGLTAEECRLARNELYARHGRKFDDEELRNYFESLSWYEGTIEAKDFQESMLSDIEIANRDLIVEYEKEMGYR